MEQTSESINTHEQFINESELNDVDDIWFTLFGLLYLVTFEYSTRVLRAVNLESPFFLENITIFFGEFLLRPR